jgi:hypothetical protein
MKKTLLFIAIATFSAVGIVSCKSAGNNDPNSVLKSFFVLLAKKDIDGATKLATKDSKTTMDILKKGMTMAEGMKDSLLKKDPMKDFKNIEYGQARVEGNSAYITITNKIENNPPVELALQKEDGLWKVDFSMATLMKLGQKQMQKSETPNMADSLKNMDPEKIKETMKIADSILKNTDPKKLEEIQKSLDKFRNK